MSQPSIRSVSEAISTRSGLATGLCAALALFVSLGALLMRKRIAPWHSGRNRPDQQKIATGSLQSLASSTSTDRLTQDALALLPAPTHHRLADDETSDTDMHQTCCSICAEPLMEGVEVRVLPCGHRFDRSCVDSWLLKRSATCPLW